MNNKVLIAASTLALILGIVIFARMNHVKKNFDHTVWESLKTTEGYDQKFIEMVNHLEEVLASRASFGYTGGTDPMTGIKRKVVSVKPRAVSEVKEVKEENAGPIDHFKLTAIISDPNSNRHTAVIMDGERSYSVDQGDVISGRRITRITDEAIYMENDSYKFHYDIFGQRLSNAKE